MGAKVIIVIDGLETVLANLDSIGNGAEDKLTQLTAELAKDTEADWKEGTPERTGRLMGADKAIPAGLSFTLNNSTYYYDWVDRGHQTPAGWHTKHGYRPAKRRSHVEGRLMTEHAVQFVEDNILDYLSKFLED